jgi:threonine dehydratase
LIAGIATVVNALRPGVKVIGVESDSAACLTAALAAASR